MATIKVSEVFGVKKEMVLSYIERDSVDNKFRDALDDDKHIIVYGASKQGKSALINKHLDVKKRISINCSTQMSTRDIYSSLLRQVGVQFESSKEATKEHGGEIGFKTVFKAFLPFVAQADAEIAGKINEKTGEKVVSKAIEFNLEIAQDITELLRKVNFNKWILIDNFHYLREDTQKTFSIDLRVFQDAGLKFIILGIWREKNRLLQFNRDLLDRIYEIPVEPWKDSDFDSVIKKGTEILKIEFSSDILKRIKEISFGNIGIVQELCKETCYSADISNKQCEIQLINKLEFVNNAIKTKLEDYSSSHIKSLDCIASSSIQAGGLYMPYHLIKIIIMEDIETLKNDIYRSDFQTLFKNVHYRPNDVRPSDITYLLNNLSELQLKNQISPPLFDYDRVGRKLRIIDSTLMFFLKFKDKDELLEDICNPTES